MATRRKTVRRGTPGDPAGNGLSELQTGEVIDPVQLDLALRYLADLAPAADKLAYFDTSNSAALATLTGFARTLLAAVDAAASHSALGLGDAATKNAGAANGVASLDANGLVPIAQIPPAALERLVTVADQAARYALTTATVQLGDTVKQTDTGLLYRVVDDTNLNNSAGYVEYTAGQAAAVPWSGVTGKPTTLSGYGITDAQPLDATLTSLALLGTVANRIAYTTGTDTWAEAPITSAALALLDDTTVTAQRQTLGFATKSNSAQFTKTSDTTLATVTGLSINVAGGKNYVFRAVLFVDADATGGHKYAISGSATASVVVYQIDAVSNTANTQVINSRQTALGGTAGEASATTVKTVIEGSIAVSQVGTLAVQFAQNAASGNSSVKIGSSFQVWEIDS